VPRRAQVMLLWLLAFWLIAHGAIPGVLDLLGLEREELASHGQARAPRRPARARARTPCRMPARSKTGRRESAAQ